MAQPSARFQYPENLAKAGRHGGELTRFWPPSCECDVFDLDLQTVAAELPETIVSRLHELGQLIEEEWRASKSAALAPKTLARPAAVAELLRAMAGGLDGDDRHALMSRADHLEHPLAQGAAPTAVPAGDKFMLFAGLLSSWYGKELRGRPSAFVWVRDVDLTRALAPLAQDHSSIEHYLNGLDKRLRLCDPPGFMPGHAAFMAGEANLHPKHIGYFFPEDEGIKHARPKTTYYFSNTHQAKLNGIAWPLFRAYFGQPAGLPDELHPASRTLPAAGVLAHELGHFIHRPNTSFGDLNACNRWVSIVLQEVVADVFGTLLLAELWAPQLGTNADHALAYYLADALGYVQRGLGLFPDSDGMLMQLNYLTAFGAIQIEEGNTPRLSYCRETVLAALRSLARVLAETLLNGDTQNALALHHDFGPGAPSRLAPLLACLARQPARSIEYVQSLLRQPQGTVS